MQPLVRPILRTGTVELSAREMAEHLANTHQYS